MSKNSTSLPEAPYSMDIEGYSPPEGWWMIPDVMRHLVAVWWGARCHIEEAPLFGLTHWRLSEMELFAQHRLTQDALWLALGDGAIKARYEDSAGNIRVIQRDAWSWLPKQRARDFFGMGYPWAMGGLDKLELGEEHRPFLFDKDQTESWLRSLSSPHVIPQPLRRDPTTLPLNDYVSPFQAITWLADDCSVNSRDFRENLSHKIDRAHQGIEKHTGPNKDDHSVASEREFEDFVAVEMAASERMSEAERQIMSAITTGEIRAWGAHAGGTPGLVSSDVFSDGRGLITVDDGIGAAETTNIRDWSGVRSSGSWASVKFQRQELLAKWGYPTATEPPPMAAEGFRANHP